MEKFELHILGCGSALPTTRHFATSQVVNLREKLFMVDCGEGAQMQLRRSRLKFSRLGQVFISHLHGDHCFGLIGLISTFGLLGRTADLHIHSPRGLEELMAPQLAFFCKGLPFEVRFHAFDTTAPALIYDDRSVSVTTIPLRHRVPCCGFLFEEKKQADHIVREMIDFYRIPVCEIGRIKNGGGFTTPEGEQIPHARLTRPADEPRRYAYCSDTAYLPRLTEQVRGVDLLFHEATFLNADEARAKETFHTTAAGAARIARDAGVKQLMIGHFSARYDDEREALAEARAIFPATILAEENRGISIHKYSDNEIL
ncbi:MAG: ribonuclease Z [Mediterranea sp.]|jgi:ribonuclease Z|nr:ribonuclease Z [Mediterranea sp.]